MLSLAEIDQCTGGRIGQFDVPCPLCSPFRKARNQRRKVLRIWRVDENFAGYSCVHCEANGYARDNNAMPPDAEKLKRMRAEADERERIATAERLEAAQWFVGQSKPAPRTIVETYLREARGYLGALPATLRYLPARGEYGPAMLALFGLPGGPDPDVLALAPGDVRGVQITRLRPDGSCKEGGKEAKKTIGRCRGFPIAVSPITDMLSLAIAEGTENALSSFQANGWGAWAAGGCARMPFLAPAIPSYIESISIVVDPDPDGERYAIELADLVDRRGMEVLLIGGAS